MKQAGWNRWILSAALTVLLVGGGASASQEATDAVVMAAALTEHLHAGRFAEVEETFNDEMEAALPPGGMEAVWRSLLAQLGELRATADPYVAAEGPPVEVRQPITFAAAVVDFRYVFDADGRLAGFWVAPHVPPPADADGAKRDEASAAAPPYADPGRFTEVELTFGEPPYVLPGTLTLPKGPGPFPGIVLVHGSGPNDRDETLGPNKPFRDLAWGLASRGIAVFRYEKRTRVHGSRLDPSQITLDAEVVDDALAALALVASRPEISRVFVVGHSLGASLAPTVAHRSNQVAGIVLLAAMARPISEVLPEQIRYVAQADGTMTPQEEAQVEAVSNAMDRLASGALERSEMVLGAPASYWQELEALDPVSVARRIRTPMLILQGGRDYQVTEADFRLLQEGLAGRDGVAFHLFPDLNHLFIAGTGPSTPAEYEQPGHVDAGVVETVARWIMDPSRER
ncbi:alpha/beta hydrolase [Limnochorda pilosa]|uniref:Serine aminopeptidase S33 domain-containing protein n=1 Tax=Limnochorda pilosa TaxID=1555112 RepID=A0A0K2SFN2_LIMPI|nr:alpha/beta fold hydrolase [Limnochorda pilosa]BAS25911.1 hypothetical protein LIP_0054 [Limnochorda pilosa]